MFFFQPQGVLPAPQNSSMYSLHRSHSLPQRPPFHVLTLAQPSCAAIRSIQISTEHNAKSAYETSCPITTVPSPSSSPAFLSSTMAKKLNCSFTASHACSLWGPERYTCGAEGLACPRDEVRKCDWLRSGSCWWLRGTIIGSRGFAKTSWI